MLIYVRVCVYAILILVSINEPGTIMYAFYLILLRRYEAYLRTCVCI